MQQILEYNEKDLLELYINDLNYNTSTIKEVKELCKRIQTGDMNAKKILIEKYLNLVLRLARKYIGYGLSYSDLIQEGNIGLIVACNRYNSSKNSYFITYAYSYINGYIRKALRKHWKEVGVPSRIYTKLQYKEKLHESSLELGTYQTVDEMSERTNMSLTSINDFINVINRCTSLDQENVEFSSAINSNEVNFENKYISQLVSKLLTNTIFDDTNLEIMKLRYGCSADPKTLDELGKMFGCTKQGIEHKLNSCLKKIRLSQKIDELVEFMDDPEHYQEKIEEYRLSYKKRKHSNK